MNVKPLNKCLKKNNEKNTKSGSPQRQRRVMENKDYTRSNRKNTFYANEKFRRKKNRKEKCLCQQNCTANSIFGKSGNFFSWQTFNHLR